MRVLVYPHDLGIGGSQINAIELAAAVKELGHEVVVFGYPGELTDRVEELGLDFVASPKPHRRPSPRVLRALADTVRDRDIQILHGYEWPPALEGWLVARSLGRVSVGTVLSMAVADFLPRTAPLIVGTAQIAASEQAKGRRLVDTIEPPVDLRENRPSVDVGVTDFRERWGIDEDATVLAMVSRLAHELKLEGILTAIDVVAKLAASERVQLLIVGDGPARSEVESHAATANASVGRAVVILTGSMADPRPAYATADIVLGMGSSALRALAFGKPLVVQGEQGYWELLTPDSVDTFRWQGWYGVADGSISGAERLRQSLDAIIGDPAERRRLGAFSLAEVEQHYALTDSATKLEAIYQDALDYPTPRGQQVRDFARTGSTYSRYFFGQYAARFRGTVVRDDFNARPVAADPRMARSHEDTR
ncbi:MAG: glycosyltransferase [Aldersonia sp.]|nr:glycosyltransferase [Aldersonia sp.]